MLLAGYLIGLVAYKFARQYWPKTVPDQVTFAEGRRLLADGKLDEAIADYTVALRLDSKHAEAYCGRGNAYLAKGSLEPGKLNKATALDKAIADYTAALRLDSQYAEAYCGRGDAYLAKGSLEPGKLNKATALDKAIADYTAALRLDPKHAKAYCGRGTAFLEKRFPQLAIDDLTEAAHLDRNSHEAFRQRASRLPGGRQRC